MHPAVPPHVLAISAAIGSSTAYFAGTALFKAAAQRMQRLQGTRIRHTIGQMASSGPWWSAVAVMTAGVALQMVAFAELPLAEAEPAFLSGLVLVIAIGYTRFGERLTHVEAGHLALMTLAGVIIARSMANAGRVRIDARLDLPFVCAACVSVALPVLLFWTGDRRPTGTHARRLTGVAYGVSSGMLMGTAEFSIDALAQNGPDLPHMALFVLSVALGITQLQIALQRCRLITLVVVATVVAKTYLLALAVAFSEHGLLWRYASSGWLAVGVALALFSLLTAPRFDPPPMPRPNMLSNRQ